MKNLIIKVLSVAHTLCRYWDDGTGHYEIDNEEVTNFIKTLSQDDKLYTRKEVEEIIKESLAEGFSCSTDSYNAEIEGDLEHFKQDVCINILHNEFINKILK